MSSHNMFSCQSEALLMSSYNIYTYFYGEVRKYQYILDKKAFDMLSCGSFCCRDNTLNLKYEFCFEQGYARGL